MKKLFPTCLIAALSILGACKNDTPAGPGDAFDSFNRKAMWQNIGENLIVPRLNTLVTQAEGLEQKVIAFAADPSPANLLQAQQQWQAAALAWKDVEFVQQGPLDNGGNGLLAAIDAGSADPMKIGNPFNATAIEGIISGTDILGPQYFDSKSPEVKGIWTLEYLLYTPADFAGSQRRKDYLTTLAANWKIKVTEVRDAWTGGFLQTFINADGRDIGSTLGMLTNDMVYFLEQCRNEKIGRPLGKRTNGQKQPQAVEARLSQLSLEMLLQNIRAERDIFLGRSAQNINGPGYDDLLNHLGAKFGEENLSTVIDRQFGIIDAKISGLNGKLPDLVVNQTAVVEELYNELQKIVVLTKVDMVNNLGIVITYTDNDGD